MPAEDKRLFMERVDLVGNDLVMCDYEVKSIHFDHDSSAATVTVTIEWYGKRESDPTQRNPRAALGEPPRPLDAGQTAALARRSLPAGD